MVEQPDSMIIFRTVARINPFDWSAETFTAAAANSVIGVLRAEASKANCRGGYGVTAALAYAGDGAAVRLKTITASDISEAVIVPRNSPLFYVKLISVTVFIYRVFNAFSGVDAMTSVSKINFCGEMQAYWSRVTLRFLM